MKVTQDTTARDYLNKLTEAQRDLVAGKEQELKNIDKIYETKKSDERLIGETELLDIQDRHQAEIAEKLTQKQERLGAIKKSFTDDQTKLEKERETLVKGHQERVNDVNTVYDYKYRDAIDDANMKAEKISIDTADTIKNLQLKSNDTVEEINFNGKVRADKQTRLTEQNLEALEDTHKVQLKVKKDDYHRRSAIAVSEHEDKLSDQNYRQLLERKEREKFHHLEMKSKEDHHKNLIKQEDVSFKQKYENMVKNHQAILDRVQNRFHNQVNNIVKDQMQYKSNITDKANDEFYQVTALNPTMSEDLSSYTISIQVPEHEKENVRLTAQKRDLTISMTRKFNDEVKEENGHINKSRRSEVFTKKLQTADIVNSKEVTQTYRDGVLSFKIAKL